MSICYKCDKCGREIPSEKVTRISITRSEDMTSIIVDDKLDWYLCRNCLDDFNDFMKGEFKRMSQDPSNGLILYSKQKRAAWRIRIPTKRQ